MKLIIARYVTAAVCMSLFPNKLAHCVKCKQKQNVMMCTQNIEIPCLINDHITKTMSSNVETEKFGWIPCIHLGEWKWIQGCAMTCPRGSTRWRYLEDKMFLTTWNVVTLVSYRQVRHFLLDPWVLCFNGKCTLTATKRILSHPCQYVQITMNLWINLQLYMYLTAFSLYCFVYCVCCRR